MNQVSLSRVVVSDDGDELYTFEYAARVTQTSTYVIERFVALGVIEQSGSMLRSRDIARIAQLQRLRQDLGLNLIGAAMVLDMAQLTSCTRRLKPQLHKGNLPAQVSKALIFRYSAQADFVCIAANSIRQG